MRKMSNLLQLVGNKPYQKIKLVKKKTVFIKYQNTSKGNKKETGNLGNPVK